MVVLSPLADAGRILSVRPCRLAGGREEVETLALSKIVLRARSRSYLRWAFRPNPSTRRMFFRMRNVIFGLVACGLGFL